MERLCAALPAHHFASVFGSRLESIRWLESKAGVSHTDKKGSPLDRLSLGHLHTADDVQVIDPGDHIMYPFGITRLVCP